MQYDINVRKVGGVDERRPVYVSRFPSVLLLFPAFTIFTRIFALTLALTLALII